MSDPFADLGFVPATPAPSAAPQKPATDPFSDLGFVPVGKPQPQAQPKSFMDHLSDATGEIWKNVNPVEWANGAAQIAKDPVGALKNWGAQNEHIAHRAEEAFKRGDYTAGTAHVAKYLMNMVPGLGQAAEDSTDEAEKGNWGSAIGKAAGPPLGIVAGSKLPGVVKAGYNKVAPITSQAMTEVLGKTTSVGPKVMQIARDNPSPDLIAELKGNVPETKIVGHMKDALQNIKDARSAEYQAKFAELPDTGPLDIAPVQSTLEGSLKRHNVKIIADPKTGETSLDFSRSTISDSAAQGTILRLYDDVKSWGSDPADLTPKGVDILKRRIDDLYTPSSNARAVVQATKDTTRQILNDQVPGYRDMTAGYARASEFLDKISEFSLESKNPGTAVRKIINSLNQNNSYRQTLLQEMSRYSDVDLEGMVAGRKLSDWAPRGLMGPASGGGLLFAVMTHTLNPSAALAMAMASPRLMGELMIGMNKLRPKLALPPATSTALGGAARATSQAGAVANLQNQ